LVGDGMVRGGGTGNPVECRGKCLRELGLHWRPGKVGWPVEKVVELKTVFKISGGKDRAGGFGKARGWVLKP